MAAIQDETLINGFGLVALIVTMAIIIAKSLRQRKVIHSLRVKEPDGSFRELTSEESIEVSMALNSDKGKHFWYLIIGGVVIIAIAWLALKLTGNLGVGK